MDWINNVLGLPHNPNSSIQGFAVLLVVSLVILLVINVLRRGGGRVDREACEAEARMMEELHAGMERMSERVENLESLLIEREKRRPSTMR